MGKVIVCETKRGDAVRNGDRFLVPVARSLRFELPGRRLAFVWNRPLGISVEEPEGRRFVRVPDLTRRWQWCLLGVGMAAALLCRRAEQRRTRRHRSGRPSWR